MLVLLKFDGRNARPDPAPAPPRNGGEEAALVAAAASMRGLPQDAFAADLFRASIHETGHQMMAIWLDAVQVKSALCFADPHHAGGCLVRGRTTFETLGERLSIRQAVAVAGMVAELLIPASPGAPPGDDWDMFERLRQPGALPAEDLELAGGIVTWHAVKRAAKLVQRHHRIIEIAAASKRIAFLQSLAKEAWHRPAAFAPERLAATC